MTGAGFGGCTVNLIWAEQAEAFAKDLAKRYQAATGITPEVMLCEPSDGRAANRVRIGYEVARATCAGCLRAFAKLQTIRASSNTARITVYVSGV